MIFQSVGAAACAMDTRKRAAIISIFLIKLAYKKFISPSFFVMLRSNITKNGRDQTY